MTIFLMGHHAAAFFQTALTALPIIQEYFTSSHRARIHPPGCQSRSCSHSTSWRNQSNHSDVAETPETQSAEVQMPHNTLCQLNIMRLGQYGAHEWQFIPTVSFYFGMTASAIEAAVLVVTTRKDPAEKTRMGNCVLNSGDKARQGPKFTLVMCQMQLYSYLPIGR